MLPVTLLALAVTGFAPLDIPAQATADRSTYEAVRRKAGNDPSALVKLALWCEAHGLSDERFKHLTEAIGIKPDNLVAQGLLGLISYRGEWLSPEDVRARRKSDEELTKKLEGYYQRRSALEASKRTFKDDSAGRRKAAIAHEKLGAWCEGQGLKDEAIAHYNMALQIDPYLDAPWKHLGYVKHNGKWMTRQRVAEEEKEAAAQRLADRHWEPLLKKWKSRLLEKKRRQDSEESLATVTDPRAVPSIVRVFGTGSVADQATAVAMLESIESPATSKELARLAALSDSDTVRGSATASLKGRETRDYVGLLIEMFQDPVAYKIQPVQGPGTQGGLLIDTPRFTLLRTYDAPPAFSLAATFRGTITYDSNGMPVVIRGVELDQMRLLNDKLQMAKMIEIKERSHQLLFEANIKAAAAQQRLLADASAIEDFNRRAAELNKRLLPVLAQAGSPDKATDQDGLYKWWYDRLGYSYEPPQKLQALVDAFPQSYPPSLTTCFAAGTPVRTIEGFRPIEKIVPGDLVLSQDVTTGGLDFRPTVMVHHNPPNQTLRITLSDDSILLSSVYHRFWRAGFGWAQARELKAGDVLRTLGSTVTVVSVEPGAIEPLYNLDVSANRSFFVGNAGVLVHDNTLPPVRQAPFDAQPRLYAVPKAVE
jgi:tetratricopeptide (TPR) repeat protein